MELRRNYLLVPLAIIMCRVVNVPDFSLTILVLFPLKSRYHFYCGKRKKINYKETMNDPFKDH